MKRIFLKYAPVYMLCAAATINSCRREELPVKPHEAGNVTIASVDMDPLYKYQVYFNLKTNSVVGRNEKIAWDLGFEPTAEGYHVVLNGAKSMFAFATSKSDFLSVVTADTAGFATGKKWDSYKGSIDSTAVGDWRTGKPVYIIDRGYNAMGVHQGWAKVQITAVTPADYTVRFAKLNGTEEATVTISKDSTYNLAFLSITDKAQVTIEPPKDTWDIAFSQYTYIFYDMDPPVPYLVTGCLLNRNNTLAYCDTTNKFDAITFANVANEKLVNDLSAIGYDWKSFNGTAYTVSTRKNYVLKDANGLFYKLHFTGFYNAAGVKGNPQWEYQRL